MLLSDGAEFLPKSRQDPEKDRKFEFIDL